MRRVPAGRWTPPKGIDVGHRNLRGVARLGPAIAIAAGLAGCGGGSTGPTNTAPATPTATAPSAIGTSVFTANWGVVGNATGYQVDVSASNSFAGYLTGYQARDVGNVTSLQVTALTPDTPYYYRVYARNSYGASPASLPISVTTLSAETYSGNLSANGQATYAFSITNDGHPVIARLTSLTGAASVGLLVGTSSGGTCNPITTNDGATVGTSVVGPILAAGATGCVRVYTPGGAPAAVTFTVSVQHW